MLNASTTDLASERGAVVVGMDGQDYLNRLQFCLTDVHCPCGLG